MKPLPTQFSGKGEVNGYLFTQIRHADKAFIYEVSYDDRKHYEVFKKIKNRRYACVSYPTSKAFGIWAWTYISIGIALNKFEQFNL